MRLPAHFCGLASLKPTAGRIPVTGVLDDEGELGALGDPRTQIGPLARTVDDVALLLRVVAGPDGVDGGIVPVPVGDHRAVALDGLRVTVQLDNGLEPPTPETAAAVEAAAAALTAAGCTRADEPYPRGGHELTIEVWRSYGEGDAPGLWRLLRRWDAFRTEMLAFARRHDVILTPVSGGPARRHGTSNVPGEIDPTSWTTPHNLTGWPAATVRAGTSPEGLPLCVQVIAWPWRDDVALAAAARIEQELGPFRAPRQVWFAVTLFVSPSAGFTSTAAGWGWWGCVPAAAVVRPPLRQRRLDDVPLWGSSGTSLASAPPTHPPSRR